MAITLTAGSGTYYLAGHDASLMIPWGGDAEFDWIIPTSDVSVLAAAQVDAIVTAPESNFMWE